MLNSFGGDAFRLAPSGNAHPIHRIRHRSRNNVIWSAAIFGIFCWLWEPVEAMGVSYSGTSPTGKLPSSIRLPTRPAGDFSMTITAAHVPAIVALLAGVLILIMPRLLNFIVAIYLIFVGLVGLGFLRMFHM
jgi:Protein of unknown function (DUF3096)